MFIYLLKDQSFWKGRNGSKRTLSLELKHLLTACAPLHADFATAITAQTRGRQQSPGCCSGPQTDARDAGVTLIQEYFAFLGEEANSLKRKVSGGLDREALYQHPFPV